VAYQPLAAMSTFTINETDGVPSAVILSCAFLGLAFSGFYAYQTSLVLVNPVSKGGKSIFTPLLSQDAEKGFAAAKQSAAAVNQKIAEIGSYISRGANAFLTTEYQYMAVFVVGFAILLLLLLGLTSSQTGSAAWTSATLSTLAFIVGAMTSILCGYIGMAIAVYSNTRTALSARNGWGAAFQTSFKAGAVMGFSLTSIGILILYVLFSLFKLNWPDSTGYEGGRFLTEALAGFGLGGSSVALFCRVGGGIYTKAADVGADLAGKVENGMDEDDPRNPATIADNVGDNVGDIAGMGADLFGSFAEGTCAAMVLTAQSPDLWNSWAAMTLPLQISAAGVVVCIITSLFATNYMIVKDKHTIEKTLKYQLIISTVLMTPVAYWLCYQCLPQEGFSVSTATDVKSWQIWICTISGLWSGLAIGLITEYYTSNTYEPVKEVAQACNTGAATNIIFGLALGYKSTIVPALVIGLTVCISFSCAGMFGIAYAALGILSTLSIGLTIDAYGPICDNAGGIAEMAGMEPEIRECTDALDAAGNTTAAIGKGFAIASALFVSLALSGAFVSSCPGLLDSNGNPTVNILEPRQFAGLLIGAMLPYWFAAYCMKSVGIAALEMVEEVRRQFAIPGILTGETEPEYEKCVAISTKASLKEMIAPGALVIATPIITGYFFGVEALAGLLAGAQVSGVHLAISSSNTGGAWDNAKKYVESGALGEGKGKHSDVHKAAVIGDTVGDPLKDTSGPALNILIKLMAIISLVFAPSFGTKSLLSQLWDKMK